MAGHGGSVLPSWVRSRADRQWAGAPRAGERSRRRGVRPGHILKNATDHIKVDQRDAVRLARLLGAGELRLVRVPEPDEEQVRDLVRSREDVRVDLTRIRNRIGKFLLRRELYPPKHADSWGVLHRKWLQQLRFQDRASELVFEDAMHAHEILVARREQLEQALAEIAETSIWSPTVARLRCLRGIDTLSALGLVAEVGDFRRFAHPRFLSSYPVTSDAENLIAQVRSERPFRDWLDHDGWGEMKPFRANRRPAS